MKWKNTTGWKEFLYSHPFSEHDLLGQVCQALAKFWAQGKYTILSLETEFLLPWTLKAEHYKDNTGTLQKDGKTSSKFWCRRGNKHSTLTRRKVFLQRVISVILKTLRCIKKEENKKLCKIFSLPQPSKSTKNLRLVQETCIKSTQKKSIWVLQLTAMRYWFCPKSSGRQSEEKALSQETDAQGS